MTMPRGALKELAAPVGTSSRPRVLILDGQTNQALAAVRSLGRVGWEPLVASAWPRPLASWSRFCAGHLRIPETIQGFACARRWAAAFGASVVLPMTEASCVLCNLERTAWSTAGLTLGCAPEAILGRAFDKGRTIEYARAAGVRVPETVACTSLQDVREAARTLGLPCVVKPRFSHAWTGGGFLPDRGCAYAARPEDVEPAAHSRRQGETWPLIQRFVAGQGKGVFALCDTGRVVAWFAHERLRDVRPSGSGSSLRRSIALSERLRQPAERLLSAMQWHGPAMVEFRDDDRSEPALMEVNGRFWNSLQLAVDAGVDFPRLWLEILQGMKVPPPPAYRCGVTLRWLWGDVKRFMYVVAGPPTGFSAPYPSVAQALRELVGPQGADTRLEIWRSADPWPALGEWVQGAHEVWRARSGR